MNLSEIIMICISLACVVVVAWILYDDKQKEMKEKRDYFKD